MKLLKSKRTIAIITITPTIQMTYPTDVFNTYTGAPATRKNRLLASHTQDLCNFSNHITEGSLASSRLWWPTKRKAAVSEQVEKKTKTRNIACTS